MLALAREEAAKLGDASPHDRATIWQAIAQAALAYRDAEGVLRVPNETLCVVGKA